MDQSTILNMHIALENIQIIQYSSPINNCILYSKLFHRHCIILYVYSYKNYYSPCRGRGRILNSPRFCFIFFRCRKLQIGALLMGDTADQGVSSDTM